MSNVLLGVIGVILFIGLALAGALFLGDRFKDTRNTSVAAASVAAVSQVSNAVNMYNAIEPEIARAGIEPSLLLSRQYLKAVPSNPTGLTPIRVLSKLGEATGLYGRLVVMQLDASAEETCAAIIRQTRNGRDIIGQDLMVEAATGAEIPTGPAGCFKASADFGALAGGQFYAYAWL